MKLLDFDGAFDMLRTAGLKEPDVYAILGDVCRIGRSRDVTVNGQKYRVNALYSGKDRLTDFWGRDVSNYSFDIWRL